jgi:hypothetical protein
MSDNTYYTRSFNSLSGADMKATIAGIEFGTLQAISYAIQREKAPIYVLGEVNPRAFSRGKRGIAGTMVFVMFDEHSLLGVLQNQAPEYTKFVKDRNEFDPQLFSGGRDVELLPESTDASLEVNWGVAPAFYMDQIPPFDITITGVNEMGAAARLQIWGAECLNEGYGISIDDMMSEMQSTYIARHVSRWRRIGEKEGNPFLTTRQGAGNVVTGPASN